MAWWENRFLNIKRGKLYLGSRPATAVAEEFGTPLLVYSREQTLANFRKLAESFVVRADTDVHICYAMKANPDRRILRLLKEAGAWIDAVSPGEVREALAAGFPARKILFTGTSAGADDMRAAFAVDGLTVTIDALEQIEIMTRVRDRWFRGRKIRVCVRWNPGIGLGFNPKAITAGNRSNDGTPIKFGIEEAKVLEAFDRAEKAGFVPVGLHQHLGSGWLKGDFPSAAKAVDRMIRMAARLAGLGYALEFLDFGGGFGPRYTKDQNPFPIDRYAAFICRQVRRSGLRLKYIAVEPGKFLISDAGVLLLRVEYVKESYGNLFACVNGGTFNTLPRPAIYSQARHEVVHAARVDGRPRVPITIAGNLCETGDVFAKEIPLPLPEPGDILAVLHAGAYARSMASNFNLRPIAREIVI
jgi:diaminopimelate decarboxylase